MNIIEGEWDLYSIINIIMLTIFFVITIILVMPFIIELNYRVLDWWNNYYWIPCLPCGASP
jgi:hypothetical protein